MPSGATFNGASNGNSVNVNMPSNITTGQVCAYAVNSCGTSLSKCVTVKGAPNTPLAITCYNSPMCPYAQGAQFTADTTGLGGCTFLWTYPATTTYVSGQGTPAITLNWGSANGPVSFKAINACGFALRSLTITCGCLRQGDNDYKQPFHGFEWVLEGS